MKKLIIFICLTVFLFSISLFTQESKGKLIGNVVDQNGKILKSASVLVSGKNLQGIREAETDNRGYFQIISLPVGEYSVKLNFKELQEVIYTNVIIHLGKTTNMGKISLHPIKIKNYKITVKWEKPLIDPTTTTIGNNIIPENFKTLPIDRNYKNMAVLTPQANTSYYGDEVNISGSTGFENVYFIDGVNVTDPYRGTSGTNLPYNFIKEIEIKTGGFEAEYGRSQGGIINIITHSGSNELHGQLFGFFTDNNLVGKERQGLLYENIDSFTTSDFGLSLGGPIIKDKLWFYGAYNPNSEIKQIEIPGQGIFRDKRKAHLFAGKLTWKLSERADFEFTVLGDSSTQNSVGTTFNRLIPVPMSLDNPDPYLGIKEDGGVSFSLQGRFFINEKFFLEASASHLRRSQNDIPQTEDGLAEPLFADLLTGNWSGGYGRYAKSESTRKSAGLNTTLIIGSHTIKGGVAYENNLLDHLFENRSGSSGEMPGLIIHTSPYTYLAAYSVIDVNVSNRVWSGFIQDFWQISPRLGLYAGLRWDGQFLAGSDGKTAQSITDQWQPRLGINYQLGDLGDQKISASYGRFYQQLTTNFPTAFYSNSIFQYTWYTHNPLLNPTGGYVQDSSQTIYQEIPDLKGQHFDEFTINYERRIFKKLKFGIRGIYRNLKQVIEDGFDINTMSWIPGNPGRGDLSFLPEFKREYTALEFTLERSLADRFQFYLSYVISKNKGNYPGLFNGDFAAGVPNNSPSFDIPEQLVNGTGLLPNDRPHVFKFFGSYIFNNGLSVGASFIYQSGTPKNEYGASWLSAEHLILLKPRGTIGRTPSLWDLNLRLTYSLKKLIRSSFQPKLIIDVFHLFSQRKALSYDQLHYMALDNVGNQIGLNPNYDQANLYQPPTTIRLGIEIDF